MAGTHRAPAPSRRSRGPATVLAVVVLVAAAIGGGYALNRSRGDDHRQAKPPSSTPATTPTSLPTVTITPPVTPATPTATSKPTHRPTAKPLPRVQPSAPKRLVVRGLLDVGFDSTTSPENGVFTPRSTAEVARWGGRGVPGSPGRDTVYLIGKVSAGAAFAKLPGTSDGAHVFLHTRTGMLTYTVQAVATHRAAGLTHDRSFMLRVPGRLQLVGIRYDAKGDRTGTVVVVTAVLSSARAGS
ncbi:MAG: hypothetical protein ACJ72D_21895 [Marmoricola sp.]